MKLTIVTFSLGDSIAAKVVIRIVVYTYTPSLRRPTIAGQWFEDLVFILFSIGLGVVDLLFASSGRTGIQRAWRLYQSVSPCLRMRDLMLVVPFSLSRPAFAVLRCEAREAMGLDDTSWLEGTGVISCVLDASVASDALVAWEASESRFAGVTELGVEPVVLRKKPAMLCCFVALFWELKLGVFFGFCVPISFPSIPRAISSACAYTVRAIVPSNQVYM